MIDELLCAVYDTTAEQVVTITKVKNEKVAIRDLDQVVNDKERGGLLARYPVQFELRVLGVVDLKTGAIKPGIRTVCNLGSLVNEVASDGKDN